MPCSKTCLFVSMIFSLEEQLPFGHLYQIFRFRIKSYDRSNLFWYSLLRGFLKWLKSAKNQRVPPLVSRFLDPQNTHLTGETFKNHVFWENVLIAAELLRKPLFFKKDEIFENRVSNLILARWKQKKTRFFGTKKTKNSNTKFKLYATQNVTFLYIHVP